MSCVVLSLERGSGQLKQRNPGSVEPERAVPLMVGEVSR